MRKFLKYVSVALVGSILLLVIAVSLPLPTTQTRGESQSLAISNVNVVNTLTGELATNQTVVVENGVISAIMASNDYIASPAHLVIQAEGKYLIPGLWDMHTHSLKISPQLHHPLFIRHGVTSVRDMSGCLNEADSYWACPADRRRWQREAINGAAVAPRYQLQSSYQANGGNEVPSGYPDFFRLNSQDDATQFVDFYHQQGVDFIKTYTELSLEQFDYLVSATSASTMSIAGHRPISVPLAQAVEAGMTSIEHGRLFMFECFEGAETFRNLENPIAQYNAQFIRELVAGQDSNRCAELMTQMAASSTHWVPTLTTLKMSAEAQNATFRNDARLEYIPGILRSLIWNQDINRAAEGVDDAGNFVHADFFARVSDQVRLASAASVPIMAGTDNIDTFVFTGSSLHDELAMLVDAGLSPLQAIQAATIIPARFANLERELGSVDVGKKADLVLLSDNPLVDIRHTAGIEAVIFSGQYFDQHALAELDAFAYSQANNVRVNLRYFYNMLASPLMRMQLAD
jgi:hypothetical protein